MLVRTKAEKRHFHSFSPTAFHAFSISTVASSGLVVHIPITRLPFPASFHRNPSRIRPTPNLARSRYHCIQLIAHNSQSPIASFERCGTQFAANIDKGNLSQNFDGSQRHQYPHQKVRPLRRHARTGLPLCTRRQNLCYRRQSSHDQILPRRTELGRSTSHPAHLTVMVPLSPSARAAEYQAHRRV